MTRLIRFPYDELTYLERERIVDFKNVYKVDDKDIYVYYTTEGTIGAGYNIIVSLTPYTENDGEIDFGYTYRNITDINALIDNF